MNDICMDGEDFKAPHFHQHLFSERCTDKSVARVWPITNSTVTKPARPAVDPTGSCAQGRAALGEHR
ncbi:hypothetical protein [Leekyejoonella antrihumi]|uniref:Uncharacterized protein n=1 Tax=Leekyejoonella antrihumi TaxID=1660198 RepID=A0A563E1L8_9MICO|nr:hypothetical protein [Leekyejoonella antrihumi]TWP35794.1 hypothetical protein FGL98_12335 [Leekyejoonella antrihumi]